MKLQIHEISGYVYLIENRMPNIGEDYVVGDMVCKRTFAADHMYNEFDLAVVADNDPDGLNNLTPENAAYCKGKESVEIETVDDYALDNGLGTTTVYGAPNAPKLKDSKVIVKREEELHPDSQKLLEVCFEELRLKMIRNQEKYGWTNEWLTSNWEDECRDEMMKHLGKGDPRDVAIYAMFMIFRGWSTIKSQ